MKFYLIAGEPSGDLQGAALVQALRQQDITATIRCWGGDLMRQAGATVVKHYQDLAFMGFVEVARNLPTILENFKFAKKDIIEFAPDCLILIDYPGFNLRMAKWAKKQGIKVFYYISPQLWAWHTSRVEIVKECVERMFVIFPFEVEFYRKHGVEVSHIGHPLVSTISTYLPAPDFWSKHKLDPARPIVALLPGSRKQEVSRILGEMLKIVPHYPNHQFVLAGAPSLPVDLYEPFLKEAPTVKFLPNQTYDLLSKATAALVTSGTATLETALFKVPQVVCYKAGGLSYSLAKRLVNKDLRFISIVNLIAGEEIVTELIQEDLNPENLRSSLDQLLDVSNRASRLEAYSTMRAKLLTEVPGAAQAATEIIQALAK